MSRINTEPLAAKLATIPWSELRHAYGDAGDVPDALLALFDEKKKVREGALRHLRHSINHQGFPENSTPVAVPFLLDILQTPGVQDRDKLLSFMAELSFGHRLTKLGHIEEMHVSAWRPEEPLVHCYQEVYDEVCKGIPIYLSLLADQDEEVRQQALYIVAWLQPAASLLLPHIRDRREIETVDSLRFGLSVSLGLALFFAESSPNEDDRAYFESEMQSKSLLRRFGAAAGACYAGEAPTKEQLVVFREALSSLQSSKTSWNHGHVGSFVGIILSWLRKSKGVDVVPMYQQVLEEKARTLTPRKIKYRQLVGMWPDMIAEKLTTIAFEKKPLKQWPNGYSPLQQWVLRFLATHPNLSISEGYCSLKDQLNRLELPRPTKKDEKLRFESLDDIAQLTTESYPSVLQVWPTSILIDGKTISFAEMWNKASTATGKACKKWVERIEQALSCSQLCTFVEELLAQEGKTHKLPPNEAEALQLLCSQMETKSGMFWAVRATAEALVKDGCLRYPMPSRLVFTTFAHLLLRLEPDEVALGAALLKASAEFFEHQDAEAIRATLLLLPEKERGEVIDTLHIRSFAEPDVAWSLYDLAPSAKRAKIFREQLREHADFFAGPGAFRLVEVLSAWPKDLFAEFKDELYRPRAIKYGYAYSIAVAIVQHPEREDLMRDLPVHQDGEIHWILQQTRGLSKKELRAFKTAAEKQPYTRSKGGVIGANGKPWDGSMPRYKRKSE